MSGVQLALNFDAPPRAKTVREMSREEYRQALVDALDRRQISERRGLRLILGGKS